MSIAEILPDMLTHYNPVWSFMISQSLVASLIGNIVFFGLVWLFVSQKRQWKLTYFRQIIELWYENIYEFLAQIWWHGTTPKALTYTTTLFIYVLRHNVFGLLVDMIVLVWPWWHHWFRPVTTDIVYNLVLGVSVIIWTFVYWFSQHGTHFISKYFPHKWMGMVGKVDKRRMVITKFLDILLWLLIWIIELLGEFGRMLSLSLRLFGNMFVGMILLTLVLHALSGVMPIPLIGPTLVFGYELAVSFLQALIFAILATIYCKLAWETH